MTFLNPLLLFGLAAAAIPVILHLLNLRKLRTIDFSTLKFLKELQQSRIRKLKLRQILLLIVRTLMVAFIVMAFARPALRGSLPAGFGAAASSSVAIVLDDSYSMMAADEAGERYSQGRKASSDIVSLLKEGDAASLLKLSDLPKLTIDPPTHDFGLLGEVIDRGRPSYVRRPLGDGVAAAVRLMDQSNDVNREIYIVSDFQKSSLTGGAAPVAGGTVPATDPRIRLFLVDIGLRPIANAAIDSVAVLSRIFEKDRPVEISARVRNFGDNVVKDAVVSLFAGGTRVAQSNVTVEPGSAQSITLTFVPRKSGPVDGHVGLETDELEPDNIRYFSFTVPGRIRVLVASGKPDDAKFLVPALRAGSAGSSGGAGGGISTGGSRAGSAGDGQSAMEISQVGAAGLARANLREFDVVVLCGLPSFDRADGDRIRNFVGAGGGLVVFPGTDSDPANYNRMLLGPMSLPEIRGTTGGISGTTGSTDGGGPNGASGLYFREIDFDHPLFATIFEKTGRTDDPRRLSPRINRSFDFRATPRSRSIITLSNGAGFFLEQAVGSGRVALFSCAPVLGWGDFPMKGLFAPLVYRTVVYLASGTDRLEQFGVGAEASIAVRQGATLPPGAQYALRLPDAVEEFITPSSSGAGLLFKYPLLPLPGHYRITAGDATLALFPANLAPEEADLAKAAAAEVDTFLAVHGFTEEQVRRLPAGDQLPGRITEARFGMELWKYCVGLVLLLALLEMAINRRAGGEKTLEN